MAGCRSGWLHGFLLVFVGLGVWDVLFVYEENKCSMTYMFQYPEYLKIKLPKKVSNHYPSYGLYLYEERDSAEARNGLKPSGIPVLFLPGNAGSYKQVRSLGSVALRKAENIYHKFHFDFYSIDFNEELVALYGGSLEKQTKFVHACIKVILKLYKDQKGAPSSVAIVGHSMGGIVARALFTLPNFKSALISLIVTQATPHVAPVLLLDSYLIDFYSTVNNHWILNEKDLSNITILSMGGGFRDYQVRSGLTIVPSLGLYNNTLNVVTSAVPRAWLSTDHLCIVWCKELVLATVRAFFDLVDHHTNQITMDLQKRMSVLHHHFVSYSEKDFEDNLEPSVSFSGSGTTWREIKTYKWTYNSPEFSARSPKASYFILPLPNEEESFSNLYCRTTNLESSNWIYGCTVINQSVCQEGVDLTGEAEVLKMYKIANFNLEKYRSFSHFVIHVSKASVNKKFSMECEYLTARSRVISTPVTHVLSFGASVHRVSINSSGLIHNVQLQYFNQVHQAFEIRIESQCQSLHGKAADVYRFHVPWSHEDSVVTTSVPSSTVIYAKLHRTRPENDNSVPELQLHTTRNCRYEISIKTSFYEVLGQLIRFHGVYLPTYVVTNILLAFGSQLIHLYSEDRCLDFSIALNAAAKPYKVIPFSNLAVFLLRYDWFENVWSILMLPNIDLLILNEQGIGNTAISILLFLFGTAIAYWNGIFFGLLLKQLSFLWSVFHRPSIVKKDSELTSLQNSCFTIFLLFIIWTTCGALALIFGYLLYLLKVLRLQATVQTMKGILNLAPQETVKRVAMTSTAKEEEDKSGVAEELDQQNLDNHKLLSVLDVDDALDTLKIHVTILHLLNWIILFSAPSFIYWVKNLRYARRLDPDPCDIVASILVVTMGILTNSHSAFVKRSKLLKYTARLQLLLVIAMSAFGLVHLYRVPYFVTFSLALYALCCLI